MIGGGGGLDEGGGKIHWGGPEMFLSVIWIYLLSKQLTLTVNNLHAKLNTVFVLISH